MNFRANGRGIAKACPEMVESGEPAATPLGRLTSSPKRGKRERAGTHAWLPYYAGYSEAFVRDVLAALALPRGAVVLDPMNGSGTTTLVAQLSGISCLGFDLNPAAVVLARAKDARISAWTDEEVDRTAGEVIDRAESLRVKIGIPSDIERWIPGPQFVALRRLETAIRQELDHMAAPAGLKAMITAEDDVRSAGWLGFFLAALLVTARRTSTAQHTTNPSWIKAGDGRLVRARDVFRLFRRTVRAMAGDVRSTFSTTTSPGEQLVLRGRVNALPLRDGAVDAVITSPPYLTRLDYAITTAPELMLMGHEAPELLALRKTMMGTPLVRGRTVAPSDWGPACGRLLKAVKEHKSKASSGYYHKTFVAYFEQAEQMMRETLRVLRGGGKAIIVVQDSWYKDVHVPLAQIYGEIASGLGARADTVFEELVPSPMAMINSRAQRYRKGQVFERALCVEKLTPRSE